MLSCECSHLLYPPSDPNKLIAGISCFRSPSMRYIWNAPGSARSSRYATHIQVPENTFLCVNKMSFTGEVFRRNASKYQKKISYVLFRKTFVDFRAHTHTRARSHLISTPTTFTSPLHLPISAVIRSLPPRSLTYPNYTRTVLRSSVGAISTKFDHLGLCETATDLFRLIEHSDSASGATREIAISPIAGICSL